MTSFMGPQGFFHWDSKESRTQGFSSYFQIFTFPSSTKFHRSVVAINLRQLPFARLPEPSFEFWHQICSTTDHPYHTAKWEMGHLSETCPHFLVVRIVSLICRRDGQTGTVSESRDLFPRAIYLIRSVGSRIHLEFDEVFTTSLRQMSTEY